MLDECLCTEKSSENLLKTAKAECVQIITFSSNSNRKFSMIKNACLNVLKTAEVNEH